MKNCHLILRSHEYIYLKDELFVRITGGFFIDVFIVPVILFEYKK